MHQYHQASLLKNTDVWVPPTHPKHNKPRITRIQSTEMFLLLTKIWEPQTNNKSQFLDNAVSILAPEGNSYLIMENKHRFRPRFPHHVPRCPGESQRTHRGRRGFQFLKENTVKFWTLNKLLVHVNSQITLHDIIHMFVKRWFLAFGFFCLFAIPVIKILFENQYFLYYLKIFERFFSENQYGEEKCVWQCLL